MTDPAHAAGYLSMFMERSPTPCTESNMHARFRVIETTKLDDASKRYMVVDLVEGG